MHVISGFWIDGPPHPHNPHPCCGSEVHMFVIETFRFPLTVSLFKWVAIKSIEHKVFISLGLFSAAVCRKCVIAVLQP